MSHSAYPVLRPTALDKLNLALNGLHNMQPPPHPIVGDDGEKTERLQPRGYAVAPMQAAPIKPGDDPMREQNDVEKAQPERSWSAAGPHAFLEQPAIEQRESGDKHSDED